MILLLLVLLALTAGMLLPVQTGVNAELRVIVGQPILAAAVQFLVGAAALIVVFIVMRTPMPDLSKLSSAPWWVWVGGLCGANYIVVAILLAPRIGAATLVALTLAGQMVVSLIFDHFGLLGFPTHPINLGRAVGAALFLAGVVLVQRF